MISVLEAAWLAVGDVNTMLEARRLEASFEHAESIFGDEYVATFYAPIGDLSFVLLDTDDGELWNISTLDSDASTEVVSQQVPSELLSSVILNARILN
jgi:hypothetical protein